MPAGDGADNLVDFLMNEALAGAPPAFRARVTKLSHGIYRVGLREVTLHTQNGRLFVFRIGNEVKHMTVEALLQEEGWPPQAGAPPTSAPGFAGVVTTQMSTSTPAVDNSAVAKILLQSAQISAGVTTTTTQQSTALNVNNPMMSPQALMSKRVEAATRAMDVSKQIVRRSINFEDEKLLRRLMAKGLKHDSQWQTAYGDFCKQQNVTDSDHMKLDKALICIFIERNMAGSINQEWAKKIIYGGNEDKKEKKKDKKDKKEKKKAKRKRNAKRLIPPAARHPPTAAP